MKTLEQQLREQTDCLKSLFFAKTREYAKDKFAYSKEVVERTTGDWCNYFGLIPREVNGRIEFPAGFYNTANAKKKARMTDEFRIIYRMGLEAFTEKELKKAEMHYESSLAKLVYKLIEKGLTDTNIQIVEKKLGVNFELLISHNGKMTTCWTIIAEGEIQRPHYRYLVK